MLRVRDLDAALDFFVHKLGLQEIRRTRNEQGRFTLVFLSTGASGDDAQVELTHNWDQAEDYSTGRFFGHLAYEVDDIYALCTRLQSAGVTIHRPPRDGWMAFIKSPDGQSVELLQKGAPLPPQEPWINMPNTGSWLQTAVAQVILAPQVGHHRAAEHREQHGRDRRRTPGAMLAAPDEIPEQAKDQAA